MRDKNYLSHAESPLNKGVSEDDVVTPFLYYPTKALEHGLKVKEFKGFSAEWSKFIILNRSEETFYGREVF